MRMHAAIAALIFAFATPRSAAAAPVGERALHLPGVGTLHLAAPESWRSGVRRNDDGIPPSVTVSAASGEPFSLELAAFPIPPAKRAKLLGRDALRAQVERMAEDAARNAVEKSLALAPLGGDRAGFYFGATDRAPKPGEFPYLVQGALALDGETTCLFTLLTSGPRSPVIPRALELLRRARLDHAATAASIERRGGSYRIALPEGLGSLAFPAAALGIEQKDDARPYYMLTDDKTGLNVSFNFEPAQDCRSSEACRNLFSARLKKLYPGRRDWREARIGDVFVTESTDPGPKGIRLDQHHVNAHLVVNGVWIDVHLSKVKYRDSDRTTFVDFIRAIRTEPTR